MMRAPSCRALLALLALGLALVPRPSLGQKVVVLDLKGDVKGRLRRQVEAALEAGRRVQVLPTSRFEKAAQKAGFKGARADSPAAVAKVAPALGVSIAVAGSVKRTFAVKMLDAQGQELWAKELKLQDGQLSPDLARRLASAVAVAAQQAAHPAAPASPPSEPPAAAAPQAPPPGNSGMAAAPQPSPPPPAREPAPALTPPPRAEPERTVQTEPPPPSPAPEAAEPSGPKAYFLDVRAGASLTWRSYCARPGVSSCAAYDSLAAGSRPAGNTVDFVPNVPYLGFELHAEGFPFARVDNVARGLGLLAQVGEGFSLTQVTESTGGTSAQAPTRNVSSTDVSYEVSGVWRLFFDGGFAGVRVGFGGRSFNVDPNAFVPLPGSHRHFVVLGADASYGFTSWLRLDATGLYLVGPAPSADDTVNYGSAVSSSGFGLEGGLSGQFWGPLGYTLHARYVAFSDTFSGSGVQWATGGAAHETYTQLLLSLNARFF